MEVFIMDMDIAMQNEQIYYEMLNSNLVKKYLNPLSEKDKEILQK
jgi:hypothetical protein